MKIGAHALEPFSTENGHKRVRPIFGPVLNPWVNHHDGIGGRGVETGAQDGLVDPDWCLPSQGNRESCTIYTKYGRFMQETLA